MNVEHAKPRVIPNVLNAFDANGVSTLYPHFDKCVGALWNQGEIVEK